MFSLHEGKLKCPYEGCRKRFEQPTLLTDSSKVPRKTNYACPHCMSKINLILNNMKVVSIKPLEYPKVFKSPAKCAQYPGLLIALSHDSYLPDECLVCPKLLQCGGRAEGKETSA